MPISGEPGPRKDLLLESEPTNVGGRGLRCAKQNAFIIIFVALRYALIANFDRWE
jgi:hypothetical protein